MLTYSDKLKGISVLLSTTQGTTSRKLLQHARAFLLSPVGNRQWNTNGEIWFWNIVGTTTIYVGTCSKTINEQLSWSSSKSQFCERSIVKSNLKSGFIWDTSKPWDSCGSCEDIWWPMWGHSGLKTASVALIIEVHLIFDTCNLMCILPGSLWGLYITAEVTSASIFGSKRWHNHDATHMILHHWKNMGSS